MRSAFLKLLITSLLGLFTFATAIGQSLPVGAIAKQLPERIGDYKAVGAATTPKAEEMWATGSGVIALAAREYVSKDGKKIRLTIATSQSSSAAYALMTHARRSAEVSGQIARSEVGAAGFQQAGRLLFVSGSTVVEVKPEATTQGDNQGAIAFARTFADTLDKGDGDIPVLIKHLPNWEGVKDKALYAVDKEALKGLVSNQPILDSVSFDGGTEAVVADYNGSKMALIEFHTPQIASDNDQRIAGRLQELRNQNQPLPAAYRRVGNYVVFVFDAPSTDAANQLIDQVKYQQMVQWLGENPYRYDQAVREFADTTLGVFVNVVKASGLVILGSLALGGLLGAILFSRRRAQQRAVEAYSDAGGMLRLNLDEIPPRHDPRRLLGPGN